MPIHFQIVMDKEGRTERCDCLNSYLDDRTFGVGFLQVLTVLTTNAITIVHREKKREKRNYVDRKSYDPIWGPSKRECIGCFLVAPTDFWNVRKPSNI